MDGVGLGDGGGGGNGWNDENNVSPLNVRRSMGKWRQVGRGK